MVELFLLLEGYGIHLQTQPLILCLLCGIDALCYIHLYSTISYILDGFLHTYLIGICIQMQSTYMHTFRGSVSYSLEICDNYLMHLIANHGIVI